MAIKSFKRYEKKYLLNQSQYDELIKRISEYMDADEHCKNGNNYSIYNIYYDTFDNQVIRHSINKPYYKEKIRLRSYKTPVSKEDKVFLEIKKKINGVVNKRRVVLTLGEVQDFLNKGIRTEKDDYMSNQVLNEIENYLENNKVKPKVYISYSRKAFFCKTDKDFRLTFDSKIITRRDNLLLEAGNFGDELLEPNQYLMEVKILGAIPLWLVEIFSDLSIYSTKFSKYGNEYMRYCLNKNKENEMRRVKIC